MTTDTRYFRNDSPKTLTTTNTVTGGSTLVNSNGQSRIGIRVWKGSTEITSGSCVAIAVVPTSPAEADATWACPNQADAGIIHVKVYSCDSVGSTQTLIDEWDTESLKLDSATWTVHYWCQYWDDEDLVRWVQFLYGSDTRNSRITNFQWSVPPAGLSIPVAMHHYSQMTRIHRG